MATPTEVDIQLKTPSTQPSKETFDKPTDTLVDQNSNNNYTTRIYNCPSLQDIFRNARQFKRIQFLVYSLLIATGASWISAVQQTCALFTPHEVSSGAFFSS